METNAVDSKVEIDTRAPFASVRAAVSLFGNVAVKGDKSPGRKPKPATIEVWSICYVLEIIMNVSVCINSCPSAYVSRFDSWIFSEILANSDFSSSFFIQDQAITTLGNAKTPILSENALAKDTQLHLAKKELNKYKEQLDVATKSRIQALAELERVKKIVEELTEKLNAANEGKDQVLEATEAAKNQIKTLDAGSVEIADQDGSWEQKFDSSKEELAVVLMELDSAEEELIKIKRDSETLVEAKLSAIQQEAEAKQIFDAGVQKVTELSKEIALIQESLTYTSLATEKVQQEESKIVSEQVAIKQSYKRLLDETGQKLTTLKKEFDPEVYMNLKAKLEETTSEIKSVQKEIEVVSSVDLKYATSVALEVEGAKEILQALAQEESSLVRLLHSLKLELEAAKSEHIELEDKYEKSKSLVSNLQHELQKCKAELDVVTSLESQATSTSDELTSALQQLSFDSQKILQEAEEFRKHSKQFRAEAEAARIALCEAEKQLQVVSKDAKEAKLAEARALGLTKDLSEHPNVSQASSTLQSGSTITIMKEDYQSLRRKVESSDEFRDMKADAAIAQLQVVKANEDEAIKKLEVVQREIEELETATQEILEKAEIAEAAQKAVQGELRKQQETEQKKASENVSKIPVETHESIEEAYVTVPSVQNAKPGERTEENRKFMKSVISKKVLMPNLTGFFHRKKSQSDVGSPSYLPGEKPL
ncbi:hypothetical protein ZIOFF_042011 [Zingiber officinale]|uniref:WEB family protein n=1 Tax=Zingiber officinale TaxID=94328 RepID=A0A8J5L1X9_ZINOF|nr:hypothetical protein ZIOFF_042011 [Zingiber officinale]